MTNRFKTTFLILNLLLATLVISSCQPKQEVSLFPEPIVGRCDDYVASGQYRTDSYLGGGCLVEPISSGIAFQKMFYAYKVGNWKYWNHEGQLIAEGIYMPVRTQINGGMQIRGRINKATWKFWNKDGERIEPNLALIMHIEACIEDR